MDPFSREPVVVPRSRRRGLSPPQLIVLSFAAAIAAWTVVLRLPLAHAPHASIGWLDALFTATSGRARAGEGRADEVVRPEHDMGVRVARQLATPSILEAFDLGPDHGVIEIEVRPRLSGTFEHLRLRSFGVQAIAVNRSGKLEVGPPGDFELRPGDKVVLIGSNAAIEQMRDYLSE